ncbi:S41 family peptidase [Seleniivibrio woodruffii]|uniref:S41 family peptidase n=1 Tax=Seleniivibrio woodruffii TaxID=1078050 RepID=UPI0039E2CEAA
MKFKFRFLPLLTVFLTIALIITSVALFRSQNVYAAKADKYQNLDIFTQALYLIENNYVEPVDDQKIIYGAIKGMAQELDPHSAFMDPKTLNNFEVETQGEFGGLGITIGMKDKILTVIAPLEDTPAFKKGIKAGDQIIKIDGKSTMDITIDDAVNKLRGKEGTDVTITVFRKNVEKPFDVKMKRAIIKIKSVKYTMIDKNIGYIRLIQFSNDISGQLKDALRAVDSQGAKAYIIDLRNNPGGLLTEAISVSSLFLPSNEIVVYTMDRAQKRTDYKSNGGFSKELTKPIVLLVNEGSASASEILTGALQDYGRATVVGAKTYGKASVQNVIHLADGSGLKLTTAKYFTPKGRSIHGIGIEPDIKVEAKHEEPVAHDDKKEKPEEEELDKDLTTNSSKADFDLVKDVQLKAALDKMKEIAGNAAKK